MRKSLLLSGLLLLSMLNYAQQSKIKNKIGFDKSGNETEYKTTDFGYGFTGGGSYNFYDKKTSRYFGNTTAVVLGGSFFYDNFFAGIKIKPVIRYSDGPKEILYFENENFSPNTFFKVNIFTTQVSIGYSYNLASDITVEPYIGYLNNNFYAVEDSIQEQFDFNKARGLTAGFSINKYFKLKNYGKYFIIYLDNNINYSNFSKYHPALGNYYYSMEIGIAFKEWFIRKKSY